MRLAGRAAVSLAAFILVLGMATFSAGAKSFGVSSARDKGGEAYFENNSFGTNREGGPAFWTDPETGDKHFRTPEMPKKEDPEQIEILPIQPEVHPVMRPSKPPIVIQPKEGSGI